MTEYELQNGCWNCRHVFIKYEHDDADELFCTVDKDERPPCMSVAMNECPSSTDAVYWTANQEWDIWTQGRLVQPYGTCLCYSKKRREDT